MSNYQAITKSVTLKDGRTISVETGKLAKQADGSVVVRMGDAMLLATVVSSKEAKEGVDFLPLSVDYQEKFASNGRIPGGFQKREGRLSDYEILISRLVDRALRPLFPDDYHADTQVMVTLISADPSVQPDALAAFAASAAISVSDIPFNGPISEVRVARINGEFKINPSLKETEQADIDLIVAASMDSIVMVEGEMSEVSEEEMVEAIAFAHEAIKDQCALQTELKAAVGNKPTREYSHETSDLELRKKMYAELYDKAFAVAAKVNPNKHQRGADFKAVLTEFKAALPEDHGYSDFLIKKYYHDIEKDAARNLALDRQIRLDGRKPDEIRNIWCETDYLPTAHGSALFTRGETQSLTTVTLGSKMDEQMIDSALVQGYNKFMLHYNFPGFSTGEAKPNRGPGRREIGHGNLALRALKKVLPPIDQNPYTVRIVSDILESNGSSSMATVCAGTLALMDAGVKIKAPVSGIAMGLITNEETGKYTVLSDILGDEDHLGDMDFKVTGTANGITACQMDIKIKGLSYDILKQALAQARKGRLHILDIMTQTISTPREELKSNAPRLEVIRIPKDSIGALIGPGGKVIQDIQKTTGTTLVVEEVGNEGIVNIFASNKDALEAAKRKVKSIVALPEIGEVYEGKVKTITPFGAFIEFMPGRDGLLHISEIKWERVEKMDGIFEEGELVKVLLADVDKKTGKYKLSRKALLPKPENATPTT